MKFGYQKNMDRKMLNRSRLWLIIPILLGLLLLLSQAPIITGSSAASASPPPPGQAVSKVAPVPLTPANDANLQVFAQALDLVGHNYVDAKTTKDLVYGSIQGVVSTLDPHSSFMNPDEFKELQIETKGKFSGIGIEITLKDRVLTVVSPIEGTPAYRAGLRAGDQILK